MRKLYALVSMKCNQWIKSRKEKKNAFHSTKSMNYLISCAVNPFNSSSVNLYVIPLHKISVYNAYTYIQCI